MITIASWFLFKNVYNTYAIQREQFKVDQKMLGFVLDFAVSIATTKKSIEHVRIPHLLCGDNALLPDCILNLT